MAKHTQSQTVPEVGDGWDFGKAKRVSIKRVKLLKTGDVFKGTYRGLRPMAINDRNNSGTKKDVVVLLFDDPKGEPCELMADTALSRLFLDARQVSEGDRVQITRKDQISMEGGHRMNDYDVLVAPAE